MKVKDLEPSDLLGVFINERRLIDVRAPVEFAEGHLPGAVNLPLLGDREREQVGIAYKTHGKEAAVKLGHELISGPVRAERTEAWLRFLRRNPTGIFYCARGGLRSQISRAWTAERGPERPLLSGGYKSGRRFLIEQTERLCHAFPFLLIAGPTGAGKTDLLIQANVFSSAVDLEALAHHRGSAFGAFAEPQPAQALFENALAVALLKSELKFSGSLLLEDESRMIGRCVVPEAMFLKMRQAPAIWLDEPLGARVQNIMRDYVFPENAGKFAKFKNSVRSISKKLGGARTTEILSDLDSAEAQFLKDGTNDLSEIWVEKLLIYYYDPLYSTDLEKRRLITFKGNRRDCLEYLRSICL